MSVHPVFYEPLSSILARAAILSARHSRARKRQAARELTPWHRDMALRDAAHWHRAAWDNLRAAREAKAREQSQ